MLTEGKILKQAIDLSDYKIDEILEKTGISRGQLYNLYKEGSIKEEYKERIAKLKLNIDWSTKSTNSESKPVPYYDIDATAGNVTVFEHDGAEYIKDYLSVPAFSDCEMFINVSGNSMYPKYASGDQIALKRIEDFEVVPFGEAYLIVTKEHRMLKYIRKSTQKGFWRLCSENVNSADEKFPDFEVPIRKVLHLFIVKGKITKHTI